jgi:RNA polymerase sporulation-specific sigma factor
MSFLKRITRFLKRIFKNQNNLLLYISNEALPKALTSAEEQELVLLLDANSDYAKQKLIEHNMRLVVYVAKRFVGCGVEADDLISVGSIGLIKAVNSYKSDKNIKMATYASKCIENEILMHLRKISKTKQEVSIFEPLNVDSDGNKLTLEDCIESVEDTPQVDLEQELEKKILNFVLKRLSVREQEIINLRFGLEGCEEQTQKEVADYLGISQSYISRLEKKIFSKLKKEMNKYLKAN